MQFTFETYDKFDRKPFADRLTKAISAFHPFADGAYVLSLNAKFGSGKTSFLKMWEHDLSGQGFQVIYLNAWETDFDEDPIIPITSSLLEHIKIGTGAKKAKNALHGVLGAAALAGNKFLEQATGIDVYETIKGVEKDLKDGDLQEVGKELYKNYQFKLNAYKKLKDELSEYVKGLDKKPLVILVDELDRVRPDYAVKFLEAIKHIFSIEGLCFVLAVDRDQLKNSAKQLYGDLDFDNYYRRFVTNEVQLSPVANLDNNGFVQQLANDYFDTKTPQGVKYGIKPERLNPLLFRLGSTAKIFSLTPRQIEYLFRQFAQLAAIVAIEKSEKFYNPIWLEASFLLIAIGIDDDDIYHKIGRGVIKAKELCGYLFTLNYPKDDDQAKRYIIFDSLAFNLRSNDEKNNEESAEVFADYNNLKIAESNKSEEYANILRSLSHRLDERGVGQPGRLSVFQFIYGRLEEWRSLMDEYP